MTDMNTALLHIALGFFDGVFAKVENRSGEYRIGMTFNNAVNQMLEISDAAGGNHRDRNRDAHIASKFQIKYRIRCVPLHSGEK